jgi:membrane protease YdiL (CAAX protease family)
MRLEHAISEEQPVRRDDALARQLRRYGPVGWLAFATIYAASVLLPPLGTLLVLLWGWRSGTPWAKIGLSRPNSLAWTILAGILLACLLRALTTYVVGPLLDAPAKNPAFRHLEGNAEALPLAILMGGFVNAFGEELVMRGFFFERLRGLFGTSAIASTIILLVTALIFGLGHYPLQGAYGAQHAFLMGLVFGGLYLRSGNIWLPVVTHGAYNLIGIAMLYVGLR